MRSNVCKIEKGTRDLEAILKESERVAEYNGLDHKQALQLRLLCEEIDGMLPNVIASVADDVIVGVKGKRAEVIIIKNFA